MSATFLYDADGNRVKGTVAGVTTVYIAGLYEYQNGAVIKYYEGGAIQRTGYASDNGVFYVVSDHLRSTSALVNQTLKQSNLRSSRSATDRAPIARPDAWMPGQPSDS